MTAMTAKVISGEQEGLQEAMEGLLQHRDPAKAPASGQPGRHFTQDGL
jgi:hypothetical protein